MYTPNDGFYVKYGILYLLILLFSVFMYYLTTDNLIESQVYTYTVLILLPIIFLLSFIIFIGKNPSVSVRNFIIAISIILVIMTMIYLYRYLITIQLSPYATYIINSFFTIFLLIFVLTGLAMLFKVFKRYLTNLKGISGLIVNFIFFLPCLFSDFIEYINYQLDITPNVVLVLFVIEIILISLIYFVPSIISNILKPNDSVSILPMASYLNAKTVWGNNTKLAPLSTPVSMISNKNTPRVNYSISMWVNLYSNTQSIESTIFSYGSDNNMKPKLIYLGPNNKTNQTNCRMIFSSENENNDTNPYYTDFSIDDQKWNYIVVTYDNTSVDLFINGNLVSSNNLGNNMPTYLPTDLVTFGDDKNINGAICNIFYHKRPLTKYQIVNTYNIMKNNDPPINNIL